MAISDTQKSTKSTKSGILAILPPNLPAGARIRLVKAAGGLPAGAILRVPEARKPSAIGKVEPKTDRLVLQEPKSAANIQRAAKSEHELAKDAIEEAIRDVKGAKIHADRDEKDPDRVAEKVGEGQSPRTMRDYSGFRIAVDSPEAWKQTAAALRRHFEIPDEQDEFEKGSPVNFHGHTVQVRIPGSKVTHEVQILPREVAENADKDHPLYEKQREGDMDAERELKDRNRAHWIAFLDRNGQTKYKLGNTQVDIDPESDAGKALEATRARIEDGDIAGKGKDVGGNHITVRYGVKDGSDPEKLRSFLRKKAPFTVTLGATKTFPPSPNSEGAAVVMAPVESLELHRLHDEIEQHGDFKPSDFADFQPHATVAYVKPGAAKKYEGLTMTRGKTHRVHAVAVTFRDGSEDLVELAGTAREGGRGEEPEPGHEAASVSAASDSVSKKPPIVSSKPENVSPKTLIGEKLRAALENHRPSVVVNVHAAPTPSVIPVEKSAVFVAPDGNGGVQTVHIDSGGSITSGGKPVTAIPAGAVPVKVSDAMLQPVTGSTAESDLIRRIGPQLGQWVARYLARNSSGGATMIATDAAKEMIPEFQVDPTANDLNVMAVASAIRDGALNTLLNSPVDTSRAQVLIVVGSPGSGKTTSLALGGNRPSVGIRIEAIPDDASKFKLLLSKILESGRKPVVEWVWAGTAKATASRMILRAAGDGERPGIGRVVQTAYMAKAWTTLPKVLEQVRREMGSRVVWLLADNSGPSGTAKVTGDMGPWLRRGDSMKEEHAHAQMNAEIEQMQKRGKIQGPIADKVVDAALASSASMPRTEILDVAEGPEDLRARMRELAARRSGANEAAQARSKEETAWRRAGETLRDDPRAQVPF
jgi:2'-5' RNA ligase